MEKKGDSRDFRRGMVVGLSISQTVCWEFNQQPSVGFIEDGPRKRKHPVSSTSLEEENGLQQQKTTVTLLSTKRTGN